MLYVFTCQDHLSVGVVTTVESLTTTLRDFGLSRCVVSGFSDRDPVGSSACLQTLKSVEALIKSYVEADVNIDREYRFSALTSALSGLFGYAMNSEIVELTFHAKGPGSVIAVQLEDSEE